jgi:hypothetical protein
MIKPESYITDDLIRAFREERAESQSSPEAPLADVSVRWLIAERRWLRELLQDCQELLERF